MKRIFAIAAFCIIHSLAYSQVNTDIKPVIKSKIVTRRVGDVNTDLDTNKLAVDEQGNKLHYYQYQPLLMSGQYALSTRGANGQLTDEYRLKKSEVMQNPELYAMIKKQLAIKSTILAEGNKLTLAPFKTIDPALSALLDNKVIVMMFLSPGCQQCMVDVPDLSNVLKKADPNKMALVVMARGEDTPDHMQYLRPIFPTGYLFIGYNSINEAYWINDITTGYVITDKDHIIRFTSMGQGGIVSTMFKNTLEEVLK